MPRVRDLKQIGRTIGFWELGKRVYRQTNEDNLFTLAAALAYSWMFSVFPFFIFLLTLLPYLPKTVIQNADKRLEEMIYNVMPNQESAEAIYSNVENVLKKPHGGLLSVGILLTLWAASGGMSTTMAAIDKCYDVEIGRPFYVQRPLAMGLTIIVATLIICVLILLPVSTTLINFLTENPEFHDWLKGYPKLDQFFKPILWTLNFARWSVALAMMFAALAVIYHFSPRISHHFRWVTPGSVFCVLVWIVLGVAFRIYVTRFGKFDQTYGTLGGAAILLLFFYIDAMVLLLGAEINSEIDYEVLGIKAGATDFKKWLEPKLPPDPKTPTADQESPR